MKKKLMISASIALGIALAGGVLGSFTASHPLDVNAAEGDKYVLLDPSDVGTLKDTQTVLITSVDGQNIMGPQNVDIRSRVFISGSAYDEASGILTGTSKVTESTEFHLAKVGDYWTIQEVADGTYLYFTGNKNKVYSDNGSAESDSRYQWKLSQGSEAFKIANRATSTRILQYNSQDTRFACYTGSQQDVNIFVKQEAPDYTVDSITVEKGEGAKDTYLVGEVFESAGYTVTAHYTNSTTADVTAEVIWPTNPLTIEDTSVEISYTYFGKTVITTIPVTVQNREVTGITIQSEPTKTEYGLNETLDLSGLVVMATYNAGEPADVTASVTTDPVDGAVLSEAGEIVVKVTYEGQEATFKINVLNSITGSYTLLPYGSTGDGIALPQGSGDEAQWNIPGYVTATWSKESGATPIRYDADDGDMRFYKGHYLEISPSEFVNINKISISGECNFTITNGTKTSSGGDYIITPVNPSDTIILSSVVDRSDVNSIVIDYTYAPLSTFGTLDHIEVNAGAAKTNFVEGDAFTSAGLVVTAYDDQGNSKIVDTGYTVDLEEGTILDTIETKVITVSYTEGAVTKTATYEIVVAEKADYNYVFEGSMFDNSGETKDLGGIKWTLRLTGQGNVSNFDDSKGEHFGSGTKPCASVSLRSELFYANEAAALKTIVVNASGANDTKALLSVKVGDTPIGTPQEITGTPTDYAFVVPNALMGHIEILFTPNANGGADLGAAVYVKSIAVYADETNVDASLALLVAQEIEAADVCNGELTALQSVKEYYDDLGAEGQALINNVYLDDYADGDINHNGGRIPNRITVAEKVAAIESAIATKSIEASSFGVFGNNNNTKFITLLSLASLIGVGGIGFFFLKKKKGAH